MSTTGRTSARRGVSDLTGAAGGSAKATVALAAGEEVAGMVSSDMVQFPTGVAITDCQAGAMGAVLKSEFFSGE
jgi:hypothetical protein